MCGLLEDARKCSSYSVCDEPGESAHQIPSRCWVLQLADCKWRMGERGRVTLTIIKSIMMGEGGRVTITIIKSMMMGERGRVTITIIKSMMMGERGRVTIIIISQ